MTAPSVRRLRVYIDALISEKFLCIQMKVDTREIKKFEKSIDSLVEVAEGANLTSIYHILMLEIRQNN